MADLAVWQRTIVDEKGDIIPGAEVSVRSYPGGSLITLYEGPDGTQVKGNPFSTGTDGFARFWAESQRAEIVAHGAGSTIRWVVDLLNADEVIGDAVTEATAAAADAVSEAKAEADRAEAARDAAQLNAHIYPSTSAGLAATTDGDYFSVPGAGDDYLILYRNDGGSADEINRAPSSDAIETLIGVATLSTDWDAIEKSGFYRGSNDSGETNGAPINAGALRVLHIQSNSGRASQIAFNNSDDTPRMWVRTKATHWSDWRETAYREEIDTLIGNASLSADFNNIDRSGFYHASHDPDETDNRPSDAVYQGLLHIQRSVSRHHQLAFQSSPENPRVWVRASNDIVGWGNWQQLAFQESVEALSGNVLQLTEQDFSGGYLTLSTEQTYHRVIAFPSEISGKRVIRFPDERGWSGTVIAPDNLNGNLALVRRVLPGVDSSEADARPDTISLRPGERRALTLLGEAFTPSDSRWSSPDEVFARMAAREPVFFDDFTRLTTDNPAGVGLASCGWRWHNTGSWEVEDGGLQLNAVRTSRQYARTGFTFKDYIAHCTVDVGDAFNFGWTFRSPNVEWQEASPRLYCRFYHNPQGEAVYRLGYAETGTNDAAATTLYEARWSGGLNRRHDFTFVQDGRRVQAFANGERLMDFTISEAMDATLGHNAGVNAQSYQDKRETRVRHIAVWRLHDKTGAEPRVFAHRGVVRGPFGTGSWDTRDPENCLSMLERLPRGIGVEVDIQPTADGGFVLLHDNTVDRTTNGTGSVWDLTTAEITALTIRGVGGRRVPTLGEFLRALEDRPDIPEILLEFKGGSEEGVLAELNAAAASVRERCLLFCTLSRAQALRSLDANVRLAVGGRNNENESEIPDLVAAGVEVGLLSPGDSNYMNNREQIAALQNAGLRAFASTTQFHFTMRQIEEDGADGYLSDYPTVSHG